MFKAFCSTGILRRQFYATVNNDVSVLSSVTNAPFSAVCQKTLRSVARKRHYVKRHWVTLPQSRRSCNAVVLPGEPATTIHLNVEKVLPFASLPRKTQKRIIEQYPPFFGGGVGILSSRMKWKAVTAERLIRLLNEDEEDRILYIDVSVASELGVTVETEKVIDIRHQSSISVYNAEQLDDPYKGEPQKGVALNAVTGKRLAQPAHDILLAVGIMRGYTSPMWVAEKQLKHLNLEVAKGCENEGVLAPNMTGLILSLSQVPQPLQKELLKELRKEHSDAFGYDLYFLYNVNGWEVMRSRDIVKHMVALGDTIYPYHFVNIRDLGLQKPKYAAFALKMTQIYSPLGPQKVQEIRDLNHAGDEKNVAKSQLKNESDFKEGKSLSEEDEGEGGKKQHQDKLQKHLLLNSDNKKRKSGLVVQQKRIRLPRIFFAEDVTLRRYYNAVSLNNPHLAVPAVRAVAILNGKLVGRRDEAKLRSFALKHKLSSPIWVSPVGARRMGVAIDKKHINDFVLIGAGAVEDLGDDAVDQFYNLDDFSNPEEILSIFPKKSKTVHFMLDSRWRPVLGKLRQEFLSSLKRSSPLWISVNECLMSGFETKPGSTPLAFPSRGKAGTDGDGDSGQKLYNSQFTTDPVRVIGLATVFTRPQGTSL